MTLRTILNAASIAFLAAACATVLPAQDQPARKLASTVGVALSEYGEAVDAAGRLISRDEYGEAVAFLRDARGTAGELSGANAPAVRALLDSLVAAVDARQPPAMVSALRQRVVAAIGAAGELERPTQPLDVAAGRATYAANCLRCHGALGLGNGPDAAALSVAPPPIGRADSMADASPALLYRVISVGVAGTPMPAWAGVLSPQQRWNVVAYLQSLRATPRAVAEGERLAASLCATCASTPGAGTSARDTAAATGAAARPTSGAAERPAVATFAWQLERSDRQIAAALREGAAGSGVVQAPALADSQMAKVVAYVRSLPVRSGEVPATAAAVAQDTTARGVAARVLATLDRALAAARAGRASEAGDVAFDAYITFEPLETTARPKNAGLVTTMEGDFATFKAAATSGDLRGAERARAAIATNLPAIVELVAAPPTGWGIFFQSLLIILREGFEAILIIGAIVTFLVKTGHRALLRAIWLGVLLALAASAATVVALDALTGAVPASRELVEGGTMLLAVVVLFSVSYWLISKVEAARWQHFIREKVSRALGHGGSRALGVVAFLAVYREGAETALFFQALLAGNGPVVAPLTAGVVAGALLLAVIFLLFYRFGIRLPLRPFFAVTSVLLYYMAFTFAGNGIRELQEGNFISTTALPDFPTVAAMGIYPTVETLLAQLVLVALFAFALVKTFWPARRGAPAAPPAPAAETMPVGEVVARLEQLQHAVARLDARVAGLEHGAGTAPVKAARGPIP